MMITLINGIIDDDTDTNNIDSNDNINSAMILIACFDTIGYTSARAFIVLKI